MLTPLAMIHGALDGMVERRFGRIVNITSAMVKSPRALMGLSTGARAGLTSFLAGVARSVADKNVTINAILPGKMDTKRLRYGIQSGADARGTSFEEVAQAQKDEIPAKRFGKPSEFGNTCAFLCSGHAGYITGQNILMDGGLFPHAF